MIATDLLRSPCCGVELDVSTPQALVCTGCRTSFAILSFGPDLMPPSAARTFQTHTTWQAAQDALVAWRKRTWTGSPQAQAQVQRSVDLAEAFVAWARFTGNVLDIGCGTGWMHGLMPSARYHGIDPIPFDQEYTFPFVRGVGDRLPFPDSVFDACCFYSSIVNAISVETVSPRRTACSRRAAHWLSPPWCTPRRNPRASRRSTTASWKVNWKR